MPGICTCSGPSFFREGELLVFYALYFTWARRIGAIGELVLFVYVWICALLISLSYVPSVCAHQALWHHARPILAEPEVPILAFASDVYMSINVDWL